MNAAASGKPRVVWVGAFPAAGSAIAGGLVTSCGLLRRSSFGERAELTLIDSSQERNPPPGPIGRLWLAVRRTLRYLAAVERVRPDAVLLFTSSPRSSVIEKSAMAWYARLRGAATLMFPRGGAIMDVARSSPFTAWWLRRAFRGAHVLLCQGPAWQEFARESLGFPAADAPIVPNWSATDDLVALGRARSGTRRAPGPLRLLFVGWVVREKGLFELLEAVAALRRHHPLELTIVGEGRASSAVRDEAGRLGLGDAVRLVGSRTGDDLLRAYAEADAFVLPSWAEGLPNSMIEAMAAGLPCVVSAVGAIPGSVVDGEHALLVPPRDVHALTAALERIATDVPLRERLGTAAAGWAAERFGVAPAADRMLAAIDHARRRARQAPLPA